MKTAVKMAKPNMFNFGEEWKDYYVRIKDLRKGDVFYECSGSGENYELRVKENPKKTKEGWFCLVEDNRNEVYDFFVSTNTICEEPNFFWAPMNLSKLDNGEYVYLIK